MNTLSASSARRNPGRVFVTRYGMIRNDEDILRYAQFLRDEVGLSNDPPIDLTRIHRHFQIPEPMLAPLPGQQGFLIDGNTCQILLNDSDPVARRRFTHAHELLELLFAAYAELPDWTNWLNRCGEPKKEQLCEQGAAALLMPASSFEPWVRQEGVNLHTAPRLAQLYGTSLLATLFQMVEQGLGSHALIIWHYSLKPVEKRQIASPQLTFLEMDDILPAPKLRVWWSRVTKGRRDIFVPSYKSIADDSLIARAYHTRTVQLGNEYIDLDRFRGECFVEAQPITIGDQTCVASILHLPHDHNCALCP